MFWNEYKLLDDGKVGPKNTPQLLKGWKLKSQLRNPNHAQ